MADNIKEPKEIKEDRKPLPKVLKEAVIDLKDATVTGIKRVGEGLERAGEQLTENLKDTFGASMAPIKDTFEKTKEFTVDFSKMLVGQTVDSLNPIKAMFGETASNKFMDGFKSIFSFDDVRESIENLKRNDEVDEIEDNEEEYERLDRIDDSVKQTNQILGDMLSVNKDFNNIYKNNEERRRQNEMLESIQNKDSYSDDNEPEIERKTKSEKKLNTKGIFSKIKDFFITGKGSWITMLFAGVAKLAKIGFKFLKILAVADGIFKFAVALWEGKDLVTAIKEGVKTFFDTILFPVYAITDKWFGEGKTKEYMNTIVDGFFDGIKSLGEKIGEFIAWVVSGQAWIDTKNAVINFMGCIADWISDKWTSIKNWWDGVDITGSVINMWSNITSWISDKWNAIKEWWNELDIKQSVINLWDGISRWISDKWNAIKEWWNEFDFKQSVINLWDGITSFIKDSIQLITQWWSGERSFKDDAINFAKTITDWISEKLSIFGDWLTQMYDKFIGWFKNTKVGKWIFGDEEVVKNNVPENIQKIREKINENDGKKAFKDFLTQDEIDEWMKFHNPNYVVKDDIKKMDQDQLRSVKRAKDLIKNSTTYNATQITYVTQSSAPQTTNVVNHSTQMFTPISTDDNSFNFSSNYGY